MTTYKIIRFFADGRDRKTIKRGLTLDEAQRWCNDPQTSSQTATKSRRKKYNTEWFDGYMVENDQSRRR